MTIKEIENLSGIPRANIRYYEQEGLIDPKRLPNGYRTYSEEELAVLEKIKLLRGVGVSLEDIRALQKGEDELSAVLSRRLRELESEAKALEEAKNLCRAMRGAGESYATLNAAKYKNALPEESKNTVVIEIAEPKEVPHPWRRYFARRVDVALYSLILTAFVAFGLRVDYSSFGAEIIIFCFSLLLMLIFEPLQLTLFKTTFGKMLFGLKVVNDEGGRLSYGQGVERVKDVVLYGMGIKLPIIELVRNIISYRRCKAGKTLAWEYESTVEASELRWYNVAGIVVTVLVWMFLLLFIAFAHRLPPNQGDLTVAQFAENYNFVLYTYGFDTYERLDENGQPIKWPAAGSNGGVYINGTVYVSTAESIDLQFEYELEDGVIKSVRMYGELEGEPEYIDSNEERQVLAAIAFAGARREMGVINNNLSFIEEMIRRAPFEDCSFEIGGVRIERDVEYRGYHGMKVLVAKDGFEKVYRESFTISVIE